MLCRICGHYMLKNEATEGTHKNLEKCLEAFKYQLSTMREVKKAANFVQISAVNTLSGAIVFALDENGIVWRANIEGDQLVNTLWSEVKMKRYIEGEET
jgi:hypothetical protein